MKNSRKMETYTRINFRKFGWLGGTDKLIKVHSFLADADKIRCDYETFESHFKNNLPIPPPICWYGTGSELILIFSDLMKGFTVPESNGSLLLICDHFCKPDNTKFNPRSLSVFKSRDKSFRAQKFIEELFKSAGIVLL